MHMNDDRGFGRRLSTGAPRARRIVATIAALAMAGTTGLALAQSAGKSGQKVVTSVCASCHEPGKDGAPKIGDKQAWSGRIALGLSALTREALVGIRKMPAHGGSPALSDVEIQRAIVYMVNKSGGNWIEPVTAAKPAAGRSGQEVVQLQCSKCHEPGTEGAPRVGDRAAWTPRLKNGLDATVRSAINGHGGMPARGGMADLSDAEVRNAVIYMFNPGTAPAAAK
jgi:cytochrome c5